MKRANVSKLICPKTGSALELEDGYEADGDNVLEGKLVNSEGYSYTIHQGIPDMATEADLVGDAAFARKYYAGIACTYDKNVDITFKLYNEDEADVRTRMTDLLQLKSDHKVLEVSAGTGKDSELIVERLGSEGELFCFDLSPDMLAYAGKRLAASSVPFELCCGTAVTLPFKDNYFDSLFCFAGVGHFPDVKSALAEMARVVKPGGRVVFCEKNVPVWLRKTEYGKILVNNNPMFADEVPLQFIPVEARDLCLRWMNGNVHYVVDYTVGEGEPQGNFDMELPGGRGGTFKTRYYGQLEGVTPETKALAQKAREKLGVSMHKWLDGLIADEARKIIDQG